nr:FeoB-associated Cys-rich membrane protein [uncultured Dethiosulfovibrio sp.]
MEKAIVAAVVIVAGIILLNRIRSIAKGGGCGCGCSSCPSASRCTPPEEYHRG